MKAIIKLDVPDWQIGQEVSVFFRDTMMKKGICEKVDTSHKPDGMKNLKRHLKRQIQEADSVNSDWVYILKVEAEKCLELAEGQAN